MSDVVDHEARAAPSSRRGVKFDPTINLGHVLSGGIFLVSTIAAWVSLDARVAQQSRDVTRIESRQEKDIGRIEVEFTRRMTDQRTALDQTTVRVADDIREIKTIMRDGFKDLDSKLDRKADKPNR